MRVKLKNNTGEQQTVTNGNGEEWVAPGGTVLVPIEVAKDLLYDNWQVLSQRKDVLRELGILPPLLDTPAIEPPSGDSKVLRSSKRKPGPRGKSK